MCVRGAPAIPASFFGRLHDNDEPFPDKERITSPTLEVDLEPGRAFNRDSA